MNLVNHASLQMVLLGIWVVALSGNGFVASLKIVTLKIITFSTEYKNVFLLFFLFQIPLPRRSLRHTRFVVPLFLNNIIFLVSLDRLGRNPYHHLSLESTFSPVELFSELRENRRCEFHFFFLERTALNRP